MVTGFQTPTEKTAIKEITKSKNCCSRASLKLEILFETAVFTSSAVDKIPNIAGVSSDRFFYTS